MTMVIKRDVRPNRMIWVTFQKAGIHCYPAAATNPDLESVRYLASEHRHMFHFKIWIEVFHNDRELEFLLFKQWLESLYSDGTLELNYQSCEMIAEALFEKIAAKYSRREVWIEVSEDGENGTFIKF
jgi:hypothetical protein